jgi:outer membrane murein-binding lipoprotein Lpp
MHRIRVFLVAAVASAGLLLAGCSSPTGPASTHNSCESIPWTC